MFIKHENSYVVTDMSCIPFNVLQSGDQVHVLGKDTILCMSFMGSDYDVMYEFAATKITTKYETEDVYNEETDEFIGTRKVDVDNEVKELGDITLLKLGTDILVLNYRDVVPVNLQHLHSSDMNKHVLEQIFDKWSPVSLNTEAHVFKLDPFTMGYFLTLSVNTFLRLILCTVIRIVAETRKMYVCNKAFLIDRDRNIFQIHSDQIKNLVQSKKVQAAYHDPKSKKFFEAYLLFNTPLKDLLKDKNRFEVLNCFRQWEKILEYPGLQEEFRKFIQPVYTNDNIEAIADGRNNIILMKDGVVDSGPTYVEPRVHHYRIAHACLNFIQQGRSGISPYDGNVYEEGQLKELPPDTLYQCPSGVVLRDSAVYGGFYVYRELMGYFVPIDYSEQDIEEKLMTQYRLVTKIVSNEESTQ